MVHEVLHLKKVLHNFMIQHNNTTVSNIDTCIIRALVKKTETSKERKRLKKCMIRLQISLVLSKRLDSRLAP